MCDIDQEATVHQLQVGLKFIKTYERNIKPTFPKLDAYRYVLGVGIEQTK